MCPSRRARPVVAASLLTVALAVAWLVGGCVRTVEPRSTADSQPTTELTFAFWAIESREVALVRDLVDRFEQDNPTIRIHVTDIPAKYYEKLMTLFAAKDPPDVFVLNYGRLGDFARKGLLADLSGHLQTDGDLHAEDFLPVAFETFVSVGEQVGRPGLYALPRDWGPTGLLVYDTAAFAEAGLAEPTSDWTWGAFAEACRKLTVLGPEGEVVRYGGSLNLYPYSVIGWFYQNGARVVATDGSQSELDAEACVEALEFLRSLVRERVCRPPDPAQDDSLEAFKQGQTAMAFVTPYSFAGLRECDSIAWGVSGPLVGKQAACGCIPTGIAAAVDCAHPAEAYRFARFWVTEGAEAYARAGLAVPAYRPALDSGGLEASMGEVVARVIRRSTPLARPYPISRDIPYEEQLAALRHALEQIFTLHEEPATALRDAAARINALDS
jgi:multiple sugar transport system substrate-binding protein